MAVRHCPHPHQALVCKPQNSAYKKALFSILAIHEAPKGIAGDELGPPFLTHRGSESSRYSSCSSSGNKVPLLCVSAEVFKDLKEKDRRMLWEALQGHLSQEGKLETGPTKGAKEEM